MSDGGRLLRPVARMA